MVDKRIAKTNRVMTQGTVDRGCRVWRSGCLGPGSNGSNCREVPVVAGDTIAGDARVRQHRGWREPCDRMARITVLASRDMVDCLDQFRPGGKELTGMATFAAIGDAHMLRGKKCCRGKVSGRIVTHSTIVQRRDMIEFLANGPDGNIVWIAVVATLAIAGDTCVKEVRRWFERIAGGMANHTVLGCRQMITGFPGTDVTVVTG